MAVFAAREQARNTYGEMTLYRTDVCYDTAGQPVFYIVTLIASNAVPPSAEDVAATIRDGHRRLAKLREQIAATEIADISGKQRAQRIAAINAEMEAVRSHSLSQTDVFATFLCGATDSHVPVARFYRGLPEHVVQRPLIDTALTRHSELTGYVPERLLYLGLFNQAFLLTRNGHNASPEPGSAQGPFEGMQTVSIRDLAIRQVPNIGTANSASQKGSQPEDNQGDFEAKRQERANSIVNQWQRLRAAYQSEVKVKGVK